MEVCNLCAEHIEDDKPYYEPRDPSWLGAWHEECAPEDAVEADEIYLVVPD